jgi:hypothetical protein
MCERLAFEIVDLVPPAARAQLSGQIAQMSPANSKCAHRSGLLVVH